METEPRPAEVRDAVIGVLLGLFGAYIGGGALWSWLIWPDQHLDASRILALLFAWVVMTAGYTLFRKWLDGEWFEGRRLGSGGSSGDSTGSSSGSNSDCSGQSDSGGGCST